MKKIIKFALAIALLFGFSLSLSYALLTDSDGPITNVFTSSRGIDIELREITWDGYDFGDPDWDHGLSVNPDFDGDPDTLGYNIANEYLPGDTVPKDPTIKNVLDSEDTYVAMELVYKVDDVEVDYDEFITYLQPGQIVFDLGATATDWTNESNDKGTVADPINLNNFFVYNSALTDEDMTSALFDEILISFDLEPDLEGYLPKLEIDIMAYAVQTQLPTGTDKVDALKDFAVYPDQPVLPAS